MSFLISEIVTVKPGILFQFGPLKICRSDEKREAQMAREQTAIQAQLQ